MRLEADGLVCDLDGVVYRGEHVIEGAVEAIDRLSERGVRIVYCTNNSRSTVEQYVEVLAGFGLRATPEQVLTSAVAMGDALISRGVSGQTAILVGEEGARRALMEAGVVVIDDPAVARADFVVVGLDLEFTYEAMRRASDAVRDGAHLIATNVDATLPAPGGSLWPGAGAIVAAIETASGGRAEVIGKPHLPIMRAAAARLEGARSIAVVGDRPETDLAGGVAMGWTTILVLSGVTARDDVDTLVPRPDIVLDSIAELE